jgi:GNAT superfamily N-acetyltransferase
MRRIEHLCLLPSLKPVVSAWLLSEWPEWYGPAGQGNLLQDVESFAASTHQLPVGYVVFENDVPIGFGSLKKDSIASHAHLWPWAASGFVLPTHRGKGVGAYLLQHIAKHAKQLGHPQVYCGTSTARSLLQRAGWTEIEQVQHAGKPLTLFCSGAKIGA